MLLLAAINPPLPVLAAVVEAISAAAPATSATPVPERKRSRWRRAARDGTPVDSSDAEQGGLVFHPFGHVHLLVARFGHTTPVEAARLTKALTVAAADWGAPHVRLAGGVLLDRSGERAVGVSLKGDLEGLQTIAREVNRSAQRLGYLLDRRNFHAVLPVAEIPSGTPDSYVQAVLAALDRFEGDSWTVHHLSLLQGSLDATSEPRELARFALSPS